MKSKQPRIIKSRYVIESVSGEDLLATSLVAYTEPTGESVLIWEYQSPWLTPEVVSQLQAAAERLTDLQHPNIVSLMDYHYDGRSFFLVYPLENRMITLDAYRDRRESVSRDSLYRMSLKLADALAYLEKKDLYHGLLSPQHVYLDARGDIRLLNFYLPVLILSHWRNRIEAVEDGIFFAPEFLDGRPYTSKSDMYGYGMLMHWLYTQQLPYSAEVRLTDIKREVAQAPSMAVGMPDYVEAIVLRCLCQIPANRFAGFSEISQAIVTRHLPKSEWKGDRSLQGRFRADAEAALTAKRLKGLRWGIAATVLFLIWLIGYVAYQSYFLSVHTLVVPKVIGMSQSAALTELQHLGLKGEVAGSRYHPTAPAGTVFEVKPPVGRDVKENRLVFLWISLGQADIVVPDLLGRDEGSAVQLANSLGVEAVVVDRVYSPSPISEVLSQSPSAGVQMPSGQPVNLTVSLGPPTANAQ
ncbi:MAG: PASTA domain-containing protein [Candidatus Margulisiibacteriota bacterium]